MNRLHQLIREQASYSELVAWLQGQEGGSYLSACIRLNQELKRYRLQHQAPQEGSSSYL